MLIRIIPALTTKASIAKLATSILYSTETTHELALRTVAHVVEYATSDDYALPVAPNDLIRAMPSFMTFGDAVGGWLLALIFHVLEWCTS